MSVIVVVCPNCKEADYLTKDGDEFECECGERFGKEEVETIECERKYEA
ncbi:MAG: hypothetical protein RR942_06030 [Romboutsia sp.]